MECVDRYRNAHGSGFYKAYLDFNEDLIQFLLHLTSIVISHLRERYTRWVYFKWIAGMDWSDKKSIVEVLLARTEHFSKEITECPPAQLADNVFEMIYAIVSSDAYVRSVRKGAAVIAED